jgi:hypothetical protein
MVFLLRVFFNYHEIVIAISEGDCQAQQSPKIAHRFQRLTCEFKRLWVEDLPDYNVKL